MVTAEVTERQTPRQRDKARLLSGPRPNATPRSDRRAMGERNGANAQPRVELKTAGWRARRKIDEFTVAGPAPLPSHGKSPCTQARTSSFSARRSPQHIPAGSSLRTLTG